MDYQRVIGQKEKALIHVAKAQLHIDDEDYRLILAQEAGVESSCLLAYAQFDKVMKRMRQLGFRRRRKPGRGAPIIRDSRATITRAQQAKLDELYTELGWTDPRRQAGFSRRQTGGKPWPQTRGEANKTIEALKAMVARERAKEGCGECVTN